MFPITSNRSPGLGVPIPTLPFNLLTNKNGLEVEVVPTVNKGLKAGVVVPMPTIPANVDVAVVLVAVKKDERTLSPNSPVEEALKLPTTRTSRGVLDGVS